MNYIQSICTWLSHAFSFISLKFYVLRLRQGQENDGKPKKEREREHEFLAALLRGTGALVPCLSQLVSVHVPFRCVPSLVRRSKHKQQDLNLHKTFSHVIQQFIVFERRRHAHTFTQNGLSDRGNGEKEGQMESIPLSITCFRRWKIDWDKCLREPNESERDRLIRRVGFGVSFVYKLETRVKHAQVSTK